MWYVEHREYILAKQHKYYVNGDKRRELKRKCFEYLGGKKCRMCGASGLPDECYDFHHIDGTKEVNVSSLLRAMLTERTKTRIHKELDKCEILCANCHRIVSWGLPFKQQTGGVAIEAN